MNPGQLALLTILLIAAILDTVLAAKWSPAYFRHGVPLFVRRFAATPQWNPAFPSSGLEAEFSSSCSYSLAFKDLSPTEYAFREELFQLHWLRYVLVMHGLISWDYDHSQLTVTGYARIFPLAFLLANALILHEGSLPWSLVVFLGGVALLALSYATQAFLYGEVGKYAALKWSDLQSTYGADA